MMQDPIQYLRGKYHICVTGSCKERRCGLSLDISDRVIIHGSKYQELYHSGEKLCDRIIFCRHRGFILAAVELKGGGKIDMADAIEQIQQGLTLAENEMLENQSVSDWFPILLYSGRMKYDIDVLRKRSVQFRGARKNVIRKDCGSSLSEIIARGQ